MSDVNTTFTVSALNIDRGVPVGNTIAEDGRGKLHTLQFAPLVKVQYGWFTVEYPTNTREVYKFWEDATLNKQVAEVILNYTNASKKYLASGGNP